LLTTIAGLDISEISIPTFVNSTVLYHQWVEVGLKDILDQIVERYGYFLDVGVDGKVTAVRLDVTGATSHIYSNLKTVIRYTPEDSFSTLLNQIIVVGESRNILDVLYTEESIKTLTGTIGWWTGKQDLQVYYSDDHTRRCTNPRLQITLSVKNFNFKMTGGSESITYADPNFLYCTITIDAPNMTSIILALIAAIAIIIILSLICDSYLVKPGWCGVTISLLASILVTLLTMMCSQANYSYTLYAQPFGQVKQSVQGEWDDLELQNKMGFINSKKIIDPLCYTSVDCQQLANFEGMVSKYQRRRVKIDKIAHLQDECGDIIQVPHPYTGNNIKILITTLTRKMVIPSSENGQGSWEDSLEGWLI